MSSEQIAVKQSNSDIQTTVYPILFAVSLVHLLNDTMQSVIPALFPILKEALSLSFTQIGLISMVNNVTAAILQPVIGTYTDRRPKPWLLPTGVVSTMVGMMGIAYASRFEMVLLAVIFMGMGSAVLHPESSRVAYLAGGSKKGLAQSIFQLGGNVGQALAPVMTATIFVHTGQQGVVWFVCIMVIGLALQTRVASWYRKYIANVRMKKKTMKQAASSVLQLSRGRVIFSISILMILVFSKNVYSASITNYYAFFAMERFGITMGQAQMILFVFLVANVIGLMFGGVLADRFSRKGLIWFSILGTAPFALALPYVNLTLSVILIFFAGLILASAFSIILVYANELLPGRVGLVSGIFFGLAFGMAGIGSAFLGNLADSTGITFVMRCAAYLPLIGLFTVFLPTEKQMYGES